MKKYIIMATDVYAAEPGDYVKYEDVLNLEEEAKKWKEWALQLEAEREVLKRKIAELEENKPLCPPCDIGENTECICGGDK